MVLKRAFVEAKAAAKGCYTPAGVATTITPGFRLC